MDEPVQDAVAGDVGGVAGLLDQLAPEQRRAAASELVDAAQAAVASDSTAELLRWQRRWAVPEAAASASPTVLDDEEVAAVAQSLGYQLLVLQQHTRWRWVAHLRGDGRDVCVSTRPGGGFFGVAVTSSSDGHVEVDDLTPVFHSHEVDAAAGLRAAAGVLSALADG